MPENYIATLEELLNGDPSETLTERRHTSWYASPELSAEFRSASAAQERLRRIDELEAQSDALLRDLELFTLED
jgi:hypothetical protein